MRKVLDVGFLVLGGLVILGLGVGKVGAETMKSESYKIIFGNFNITSGTKSSSSYTLTDTVGQTAAGEFDSTGYIVKAGFQYLYALYDFSFSISDLTIDFGSLTPGTPATATNVLTVSAPGAGYAISVFENHPLKNVDGDEISDTTCDDGSCSESSASPWTLSSVYGFGFNLSGDDVASDFVDGTYFRQFANFEAGGESPQVIMSSSQAGKNRQATVTYKVNISGSQAAGNYSNYLVFVATPSY